MAFFRRLTLFAALLGAACLESPYVRASRVDTIAGYREFLRDFPKDMDADAATERLSELEFERARSLHTVIAYKRYLEEFPDSGKTRAARALLEGLRFNAASKDGSAVALRQFLADHPDGAHRAEAKALLDAAEAKEALASSTPAGLEGAIARLPDDERRAGLERRLDDETYAAAKAQGAGALLAYLEKFEAGAHREEAKTALLSLQVDALLDSNRTVEARALLAKAPLAKQLTGVDAALAQADERAAIVQTRDPKLARLFAPPGLRSIEVLADALQSAPDPLDRWEAAIELGQHVDTRAIDPLLAALRTARNAEIRTQALASLRAVFAALPPKVAEYERATRLDALSRTANSPELYLEVAALLDLGGRLEEAAAAYQKAFDPNLPDPAVLGRWIEIRAARREWFSSAVAARQLSAWARQIAQDEAISSEGGVPRRASRSLCAAARGSEKALAAIRAARGEKTEFPTDLVEFERRADEADRLVRARLADAELLLRTQDPRARLCADTSLSTRLASVQRDRLDALATQGSRLPRRVLEWVGSRDPSAEVRAKARALWAGGGAP